MLGMEVKDPMFYNSKASCLSDLNNPEEAIKCVSSVRNNFNSFELFLNFLKQCNSMMKQ